MYGLFFNHPSILFKRSQIVDNPRKTARLIASSRAVFGSASPITFSRDRRWPLAGTPTIRRFRRPATGSP